MKNLVEYSSSESETEGQAEITVQPAMPKSIKQPVIPRANKLPMLLETKSLNSQQKESSEDHQMRTRSIPHVEGNWVTHVFIDCPLNERLSDTISELEASFEDIHAIESPHVSLSKTFILRFHWIESFFASLRDEFKNSSQFQLQFSSDVVFFANEDRTRYFACVLTSEWCNSALASAIKKVDSCLQQFGLKELYYEEPSFHASVLWKLSEFTADEKREISCKLKSLMDKHHEVLSLYYVDKASCKSGNKLIEISLQ